ncbi:conjugal transfer protein TraD [Candidatus Magnetomorum sp. HK-1]|nr:conjugal transfer protein TraD [Candidatus Magnetomorum sp. HK-1]
MFGKYSRKKKGFPFANIYFPYEAENHHTLTVGAARSGKNGPLLQYISEIRRRGNKFICHDRKGELASIFYRHGIDHIINLYDQRFEDTGWNLMREIENPHIDIPLISSSLIPDTNDAFWSNAARFVLEGILHSAYEQNDINNMGIWSRLSCSVGDIVKYLKNSNTYSARVATDVLANGDTNNKMAHSVLSILRTYSGIFEPLKNIDGQFTTKRWLGKSEGDIFLTNYAKTEKINRPLLTLFIDLAISEILTRPNTYNRSDYIYLFLSEFNALQKMDSLNSALTEGAAKGLCLYTEIQDFGKTEQIYGNRLSKSIQANHGTVIIFRSRGQNADECSRLFSKIRVKGVSKSKSSGNSGYYSNSETKSIKEQTLILPSQISNLKPHHAFIWYPGHNPVKVEWCIDNWKKYQRKHESFKIRKLENRDPLQTDQRGDEIETTKINDLSGEQFDVELPEKPLENISSNPDQEQLKMFLDECTINKDGEKVRVNELYDLFNLWCELKIKSKISQWKFYRVIKKLLKSDKIGGISYYLDIEITDF